MEDFAEDGFLVGNGNFIFKGKDQIRTIFAGSLANLTQCGNPWGSTPIVYERAYHFSWSWDCVATKIIGTNTYFVENKKITMLVADSVVEPLTSYIHISIFNLLRINN